MQPKRQMRRSRCGRRCRYRQPLPLSLPPPQALPLPLPLPSAPLLPRRPVNDVSGAINSIGSCFLHTWPTHYFFIPLFVSPFPPLSLSLSLLSISFSLFYYFFSKFYFHSSLFHLEFCVTISFHWFPSEYDGVPPHRSSPKPRSFLLYLCFWMPFQVAAYFNSSPIPALSVSVCYDGDVSD